MSNNDKITSALVYLRESEEGIWLGIESDSGKVAAVNLSLLGSQGGIIRKAFDDWARARLDQPMKAIAIGYQSDYRVYIGLTREQAIERHEECVGPITKADEVKEVNLNDGCIRAYEIWEDVA